MTDGQAELLPVGSALEVEEVELHRRIEGSTEGDEAA